MKARGVLHHEDTWWIANPSRLDLSLHFLVGHYGQIVVTAFPNLEKLKEKVGEDLKSGSVEVLQSRITKLRDMLSQFNDEKDDIDV